MKEKPLLLLAPMVDLSHVAYRELIRELGGCDLFYSEMLNARRLPLETPQNSVYLKWSFKDDLILQLIGCEPEKLARAAGVRTHPVPDDAERFFDHAAPDTVQLIVLEDLTGPVQFENGDAYRTAIESLERRWFAPLRKALVAGKLKALNIEATTVYATLRWECRRKDQWKFWKKPQTLADLAMDLAKNESSDSQ